MTGEEGSGALEVSIRQAATATTTVQGPGAADK